MKRRDKRKLSRDMMKAVKEDIDKNPDFIPQTPGDVIACTIGFEYHKAKTMREALYAGAPLAKKILEAIKEFRDGE